MRRITQKQREIDEIENNATERKTGRKMEREAEKVNM